MPKPPPTNWPGEQPAADEHEIPGFAHETIPGTSTVPRQNVLKQPPGTQSLSAAHPWLSIGSRHCPWKQTPVAPPGRVHPLPLGVVAMHVHLPATHPKPVVAALQLNAHDPQLLTSVCSLTHAPLHIERPLLHTHAPPMHVDCDGQEAPHMPQLFGSVIVLTHAPLQFVGNDGLQAQEPEVLVVWHTWFAPHWTHATPPVPQLVADSLAYGSHADALLQQPAHPLVVLHAHWPDAPVQDVPGLLAAHEWPHVPQLGSAVGLTHAPLHASDVAPEHDRPHVSLAQTAAPVPAVGAGHAWQAPPEAPVPHLDVLCAAGKTHPRVASQQPPGHDAALHATHAPL